LQKPILIVLSALFAALVPVCAEPHPAALPTPRRIEIHPPMDSSRLGSPLRLDRGWKVGITADPAAAQPEFNDTQWVERNAQPSLSDVPEPSGDEDAMNRESIRRLAGEQPLYAWFRLHLQLAPGHGPLGVLVELPVSENISMNFLTAEPGIDLYANGKLIEPEGPHGDDSERYQQISRIYRLKVPSEASTLVLAVRTPYTPFGYASYTNFFAKRAFWLGEPGDLHRALAIWSANELFARMPRLVYSVLLVALSLFLLALYFGQRGHVEYLWLALHELLQAPFGFLEQAGSQARLESFWYAGLALELFLVSSYLYFEFLVAFLRMPRRWYVRTLRSTAPVLATVGPLLLSGHGKTAMGMTMLLVGFSALWIFGWLLFIFLTLFRATLKKNFEAGLLLLPLVLSIIGVVEPIVTTAISEMSGRPYHSPLTIEAGPVPINFASIADFTGIVTILLIILFRFLRIQGEQERASNELAAARSVQELIIPQEKLSTPGFEVDSVYEPANEVGGDFFHIQPTPDGGLLVVVGDVAGKGLKAAMSVSMLIGALRGNCEHEPARILAELNRVLAGSESFTTCQVALFAADGELTLANAGHPPPYLSSQEIALEGSLPLGVVPEVSYDETRLYLHPGDRILFYSDGVVEARRPSGELFGFDRVHNLSNQPAYYIADAAKVFGQEDDITVVTVKRLEPHTT
jgi:phosphoserine phosphatase RsbU/P